MRTSVIIPAAGESHRWNNYLGMPKHLVPIGKSGQALINRTIELLISHGIDEIYVITDNNLITNSVKNAQIIKPEKSDYLTDTILSTRERWTDKTTVMLGDVFYSRRCVETILKDSDDLKFYGMPQNNKLYRRAELYAFSFTHLGQKAVLKNLETSSKIARLRDKGNLLLRASKEALVNDSDCLKKIIVHCYPAKAPRLFRKLGISRSTIWKAYRALKRKPCYDWMFGKLWGLFLIASNTDPFEGENYEWPDCTSRLLETIDDITRDIDTKEDYIKLIEKLRISEKIRSA